MALVVLAISTLSEYSDAAYTVDYYDCNVPTQISTYQHTEICKHYTNHSSQPTTYTLLQRRLVDKLSGYSCKITRSTWTQYCGAYSHAKMARPPEIEIPEPGSTLQCHQLIRQGVFTTLDGKTHPVKLDTENIMNSFDLGTIHTTGDGIACQGENYRIGDQIIQQIVRVSQYKVIIQQEEFIVEGNQVESLTDRTRLPMECHPQSGGCQLASKTFIWSPPTERCELERIRTASMIQEGDYLVDNDNKILLKKLEPVPTPNHCGQNIILSTEYQNLFLTTTTEPWDDMTTDVDITEFVEARDDYLMWTIEKKLESQNKGLLQHMCLQDTRHHTNGNLIHIKDNHFIKRNGDAIEYIQCSQRSGRIREDALLCYDQIPIDTPDGHGFVQPSTRTFTTRATPRPCSSHFGLKIRTGENLWIELNPYPKTIPDPDELPLVQGITWGEHDDLGHGGIYSDSELASWRKHLEIGDFHESVSKTISYGVCIQEGECHPHPTAPIFNLQHLENPTMWSPLSWWNKLDKALRSYTTLLCLTVILIELGKMAILLGLFIQVALTQGMEALKATAYLVCCTAHRQARKVIRRRQRHPSVPKEEVEMDERSPILQGAGCSSSLQHVSQ